MNETEPQEQTDFQNIWANNCLVVLESSVWTARKKINPQLLNYQADPRLVNAAKRLVDPDTLKGISGVRNEARQWLYAHSVSCPIKAAVLLPKMLIPAADDFLNEKAEEFAKAVESFLSFYQEAKAATQAILEPMGLWNCEDYPSDIRSKFAFSHRFMTIGVPGASVLPPEIYKREEQKLKELMQQTVESAVIEVYEQLHKAVEHLAERMKPDADGRRKRLHETTVENLRGFLGYIDALNITNNQGLRDIAEKCRKALTGEVTADALKENALLRESVGKEMESISAELAKAITTLPGRRLIMDGDDDVKAAA